MARWKEPSTYAGLAAIIGGVGAIAKVHEAPAIADAVNNAAVPLASGDWKVGLAMILTGALGVFLREGKNGR